MSNVLVFGALGTLGTAICQALEFEGHDVLRLTRNETLDGEAVPVESDGWIEEVAARFSVIDGVVWSQGVNFAGAAGDTTKEDLETVMDGNVSFIHRTFSELLGAGCIGERTRGVVLGSVWGRIGRQEKFAYMVSKAALSGLVQSLTIDYAARGFVCNSVMAGVVDTPMTRANLSASQVAGISRDTPGGALVSASEIAQTVTWLLSPASSGISGQSIVVDRGWSISRYV